MNYSQTFKIKKYHLCAYTLNLRSIFYTLNSELIHVNAIVLATRFLYESFEDLETIDMYMSRDVFRSVTAPSSEPPPSAKAQTFDGMGNNCHVLVNILERNYPTDNLASVVFC